MTNRVNKSTLSGGGGGKNQNFNTIYRGLGIFKRKLKKVLKYTLLKAVRGFLSTKNRFYVENQCKKTCFKCSLFNLTT